ncbi:MAG: DUF3084 domain-containing protein [Armatimonadota bacterium]|nr:DUF3084 domain-containing protein [bacterium]
MRYSILFVIILVMVSGFIAYFGDLLGRKMGKKRLSVLRLRPRYTAIVVTTITGMVISALVLAAMLSVNAGFREAFTQWEKVTSESRELATRNKALLERSKHLEIEAARLHKDEIKARKAASDAVNARNAAVAVVAKLKREISKRKLELDALRIRSSAAEHELAVKAMELKSVQQCLRGANNDLKRKKSDLMNARAQLATIGAQLTQTNEQLAQTGAELAAANVALKQKQAAIEEQRKSLVELGKRSLTFEKESSALRSRELIFRQDDELCRGVISPRQSLFAIKGDLFSILDTASTKAENEGAKIGENQRAVHVIYLIDSKSYAGERECIEMAMNTIASSRLQDSDTLVQVVCANNTVAGEQVQVELRLYLNNLVYPKDKLIARAKIDGRKSEGRILLSVINFLQTDVSQAALRAGIIPVSNPDPRVTAGVDPAAQVEGLMEVVDRIKTMNSTVKLDAFASSDIFATGPMNMDNMRFNVTKAE